MEGIWANVGAVWGAGSIALSACLYLVDLGTTMTALVSYYYYQYHCPHADPTSPLLRHDPICRAIRSDPVLHGVATEFWTCVSFLLLAHVTYAIIFWITLHRRHHPLRLAYLMPLIHLYRLLKLLCHSCRLKDLKELQQSQRETNSLYNALGASLETASQFIIQFCIVAKLGEYIKGSSDPSLQAQSIPKNLILSLVASLISGCYSTGTAVSLILGQHMSYAKTASIGIVVGFQTLAAMLAKAMNAAALTQFAKPGLSMALVIHMLIGVIIAWIFVGFSFQNHYQGKNKCLKILHSLGLALMIRPIGPIYVIVKKGKGSCLHIWGTLAHVFVELIGVALVFLLPGHVKKGQSPCHAIQATSMIEDENKYLTCKVFMGTMFSSLFVIILTTILFIWLTMESDKNEPKMESDENVRHMLQTSPTDTDIVCNKNGSSIKIYPSNNVKVSCLHQMSTPTLFFRLILVVITIIFIQKLQRKFVLKGKYR